MSSEQPELFVVVGSGRVARPHQTIEPPADQTPEPAPAAEPLFPLEACEAPSLRDTFTRKLTKRQKFLIRLGWHPLARALRRSLRLHPEAIPDPAVRKGGPRCGTCAYRQLRGGAQRDYPKCYLDPLAVTRGQATDCRSWWPGCTEYKEEKCPSPSTSRARSRRK